MNRPRSFRSAYYPAKKAKKGNTLKARILIICEGRKTEPNYLNALVYEMLRLGPSVGFEIVPHCGTAPMTIARKAEELLEADDRENPITAMFCVFDKDNYGDEFYRARDKIKSLSSRSRYKNKIIRAITSIPCFELWIYLHISYYSAPVVKTGSKSPAEFMISKLKKLPEFTNYEKAKCVDRSVLEKVETAAQNAEKLSSEMERYKQDNPTTLMHELYRYLKSQQ